MAPQKEYYWTPEGVRIIREMIRWWQTHGNGVKLPHVRPPAPNNVKGELFKNTSGEEIPPYSCIAIDDVGKVDNVGHSEAVKPDTTFRRSYGITWAREVEDEKNGRFFNAQQCIATYDSGTPANGEMWGPKPGQWTLSKGYPGFRIEGVYDSTKSLAIVVPEPIVSLVGKADGAITAGNSGTVSVWVGTPGSEVDSTMDVTAFSRFGNVNSGAWVSLSLKNGHWYIDATACGS